MSSIVAERQFGRHFKRQFGGEGNCESKIAARQGVSIFAARHQDVSHGPLGCFVLCVIQGRPKHNHNFPKNGV